MKYWLVTVVFLFAFGRVYAGSELKDLLKSLDEEVAKKEFYQNFKIDKIEKIKTELHKAEKARNQLMLFDDYVRLYSEYKSFIYDSAFFYALKAQKAANMLDDNGKVNLAKLNMGFVLTSSGMFKEAFDTLSTINTHFLTDSLKQSFYMLKARAYMDLIGYNSHEYFASIYSKMMNANFDSSLAYCKVNSPEYLYLMGLKCSENMQLKEAQMYYEQLVMHKLDDHFYAMATSSLAYVYLNSGDSLKAIQYLVEAVKTDLRSSTKETVAAHRLAELLYKQGLVTEAYSYIKLAMDDASFYKANFRKKQISSTLPVIEGKELSTTLDQKRLLSRYLFATVVLSVLVVLFLLVAYKNVRELKKAKTVISDSNERLRESNKIKDEYIGYFFTVNSEYIDKIEKLKKAIYRKMATKRIEDIEQIANGIDIKHEREELYQNFDKIFLKLFPNFVNDFNALFNEEDKIVLKDSQLLNTDLRIFALFRLGINDTEKISKILEYSVNTIYAYKTRIKNKSIVPNEQFDQRIMEIKAM